MLLLYLLYKQLKIYPLHHLSQVKNIHKVNKTIHHLGPLQRLPSKPKIDISEKQELGMAAVEPAAENIKPVNPYNDIGAQKQLENPPKIIKAVYATGWSAGSKKKMDYLIDLIKKTELNAVVIDIKDYSGELSYLTDLEDVEKYSLKRDLKILQPNALIKRLHDEGIYAIARQTVFQDPVLALARPDLALTSSSTGKQWTDFKGVM